MCGIAGVIGFDHSSSPEAVRVVERMTDAQAHRGPDDGGVWSDACVALGSRRLSIIDLSSEGHQPMANEDGSIWITYNGEIYNFPELRADLAARGHRFRSRTDTEVIIHGYEEWGIEGVLRRLRGMFAFALYDRRPTAPGRSSPAVVYLARDRLGIKPLYYWTGPAGRVVFASEVKALLAGGMIPADRDPQALVGLLLLGSIPAPHTAVVGVRCLLPGHYMELASGGATIRAYWDLSYAPRANNGDTSPVAALRDELEEAVRRHLISDVPLGVFLSGGVDSAGLVALARRGGAQRLRTLTVTFDEPVFNEGAVAQAVAGRYGTDHHDVRVTYDDFIRELPNIAKAMDQPTNDGVNTYFIARAARSAGLTVVLSGLGGDEVFWGYPHYRKLRSQGPFIRTLARMPEGGRRAFVRSAAALGRVAGSDRWGRLAHLGAGVSWPRWYLVARGFFAPRDAARLLDVDDAEFGRRADAVLALLQVSDGAGADGPDALNYIEMKRYLHDQLLRDTDAFAMAHSIEVRVPYLDHHVVERVAGIGPAAKLNSGLNKPLLVEAVADPVVEALGRRPKHGFTFPMEGWMQRASEELEAASLRCRDLRPAAVRCLWTAFRRGRLHWSRAWALVVLGSRW